MNTRQFLRNVLTNYARLIVASITNLVLTPIVFQHLGSESFGLWALTLSIQAYFGLADLGIASASVRYIARYRALKDWESMNRTIGSAFAMYLVICVGVILLAALLTVFSPSLFRVSPGNIATLQMLMAAMGLLVCVGLLGVLPIQCVIAAQRLDAFNLIMLGPQLLSSVASVIVLLAGGGVIGLAFVQVAGGVANAVVGVVLARRYLPEARLRPQWSTGAARSIIGFASAALAMTLAGRIIYLSDSVVISAALSVAAVAPFAIGGRGAQLLDSLVGAGSSVLGTFASEQDALRARSQLSAMWAESSKWTIAFVLPLAALLIVHGGALIQAWIGSAVPIAATVVAWLALGRIFDASQSGAYQILFNSGHHKQLTAAVALEAAANLALSIALVKPLGVVGVAIGTALPMIARAGIFYPAYAARVLGLPLATYLRVALLPALVSATPALILIAILRVTGFPPGRFAAIVVLAAVTCAAAVCAFRLCIDQERRRVLVGLGLTTLRRALPAWANGRAV